MAKKLTSSLVIEVGKGMAQKWIKDKTTPKESLLAAFGAEDHGLVVWHVVLVHLQVKTSAPGSAERASALACKQLMEQSCLQDAFMAHPTTVAIPRMEDSLCFVRCTWSFLLGLLLSPVCIIVTVACVAKSHACTVFNTSYRVLKRLATSA